MTYDLTIGESYSEVIDEQFADGKVHTYEGVKSMKLPEAPAFPGAVVSAHSNSIMIPWGGYGDFQRAISFFNPELADILCTGSNDSENVPIDAKLINSIQELIVKFREQFPGTKPSFSGDSENNAVLARLEILLWWSQYALENFGDKAAIHIS